jgi:hypothetical protein
VVLVPDAPSPGSIGPVGDASSPGGVVESSPEETLPEDPPLLVVPPLELWPPEEEVLPPPRFVGEELLPPELEQSHTVRKATAIAIRREFIRAHRTPTPARA